jgi:hypothetical protein
MAAGNSMPFFEAAAATGSGGVLRHEYRVSSPRSLFAVVLRRRRGEPLRDECPRMLKHDLPTFFREILPLFWSELKAATKAGLI